MQCSISIRKDSKFASKANKSTNPCGFTNQSIKWEDIGSALNSSCSYTAGSFKSSSRSKKNFIDESMNILMYDIDEGMTIEECLVLLKDYNIIILTTKNHSPMLHKFRVLLQMKTTFDKSFNDYYSSAVGLFAKYHGLTLDDNARDISRYFAGFVGAEVYYNYGGEVDFCSCLEKAKKLKDKKTKIVMKLKEQTAKVYTSDKKWNMDEIVELPKYNKIVDEIIQSGSMNLNGVRLGGYLKAFGLTLHEIVLHVCDIQEQYYTGDYDYGYDYWNRYIK